MNKRIAQKVYSSFQNYYIIHLKMKYLYLFIAVAFLHCTTAPKVAGQFTEAEFAEMADKMAKGSVRDIDVKTLKANPADYIILDTREKAEYDISHLEGAIWVGYDDFKLERLDDIPKGAKVLTYCSVGYRSERIGEKLQKAGYTDVYNLYGSIFSWINAGYPLVKANNEPTNQVHGYNQRWGKWVKDSGVVVY